MQHLYSRGRWLVASGLLLSGMYFGISALSTAATASEKNSVAMQSPVPAGYERACGECHMAYPPVLLPVKSWERLMSQLDNHFDENAELLPEEHVKVDKYLISNAGYEGQGLLQNMQEKAPLRITLLPEYLHEHDELKKEMTTENPQVVSLSNCDACHQDSVLARFEEDMINIPGFGPWED